MGFSVVDPAPDTAQWLRARKQGLGASDSAAVMGLSKYGTALSVYLDKLSDRVDTTMSDRQDWGHRLEEPIAGWVQDLKGLDVQPSPGLIRSEEYPWLLATPDRLVVEPDSVVPLEIKTSDAFMKDDWQAGIPFSYQIQLQQQVLIMGAAYGYMVVLHGGNTPAFYRVAADTEFHELLIRVTKDFWLNHVQALVPPEPVSLSDVAALYRGDPEVSIEGSEALYDLWGAYGLMQAEAVAVNEKLDGIKFQLQMAMKDATALTYQGKTLFTWRPSKGSQRFDTKRFEADHADLYRQYLAVAASTRPFVRKKNDDL